ncbi:MAG TPA: VTT domain-containing protein [Alphaproteobacteria bacterium]|nr:VTT domain-containing protein [Alphaproteobacteria bacterium]
MALIAIGAFFAISLIHKGAIDPDAIRNMVAGNGFAPLIFIALQVLASLLFVPRTFLGIAAGLLFGFAWGALWAMLGAVAGAAAGFALWRWIGEGQVDVEAMPKVGPLILKAEQGGWRTVAILRLIGPPHSVVNTALALTKIGWTDYLVGSTIGMLPTTLVQVDIGATGGAFLKGGGTWIIGSLALAGLLAISFFLKRAVPRT